MFNSMITGMIQRRDWLGWGALSALGLGLNDWLHMQAQGAISRSARAKSCILIWLDGGPSHLEMFDPKPDAPVEVRGPFGVIKTRLPGVVFSENLPLTAQIADQLTVIRSLTSPLGEHGLANTYLLTGYKPSPVLSYPSLGSIVAASRPQSSLPAYIAIPNMRAGGAGFLDARHQPFDTGGDPSRGQFAVRDLNPFPMVTEARLARRLEFLKQFDGARAQLDKQADQIDPVMAQAFGLALSREAREAFDASAEPAAVRDAYGAKMIGQSCLLARRLIERGVPFVSINNTGWDTHNDLVVQLRDGFAGAKQGVGLIPSFDRAFSALLADLRERNLLEQTLVVAMGEFGRTPKLNARGGRDHWPGAFGVALAGGGVSAGQVLGQSDATGESPTRQPITPADLAFSILSLLGIDPRRNVTTPDGRPVALNRDGHWIKGLAQ